MTDLEKAARMALEALEAHADIGIKADKAITALRQALSNSVEQPAKQRHIAYVCPQCYWTLEEQPAQQEHKPWCASLSNLFFDARPCDCKRVPLPPPQRKPWAELTDEAIWLEYQTLWPFHPAEEPRLAADIAKFARAIEAKLKEKNIK